MSKLTSSHKRAIKLIQQLIRSLAIDLKGATVLTEVGSNYYIYTPIIAALCNAGKVFAWTADTRHGKADDIVKESRRIAEHLGVANIIDYRMNTKPESDIELADVITNSGFIRPIDSRLLASTKKSVVIPLMYEAWEIREQDIDIEFCKKKSIKVAGTNEGFANAPVFEYVQELAVKMIHEAGYEIKGNKIVVWSNDHFGDEAKKGFENNGATEVIVTTDFNEMLSNFADVDFVFICDYDEERPYVDGVFNIEKMLEVNAAFGIVHLYGDVNTKYDFNNNISFYPKHNGKALNMSFTLGHVGLRPIINLQVAGFKVAQEMLEGTYSEISQPITT